MRVLLDTHIFIWYAKEQDKLSNNVLTILSDYETCKKEPHQIDVVPFYGPDKGSIVSHGKSLSSLRSSFMKGFTLTGA